MFVDARWALFWSADVLRKRRLPKLGAFWREVGAEGTAELRMLDAAAPKGAGLGLPADGEARLALALKLDALLHGLGDEGLLLRQLAWGDAWDERVLDAARRHQETARRQGLKVRLSYRYTYRQLAALHGGDAKSVWRRVRRALEAWSVALAAAGLLWRADSGAGSAPQERLRKPVEVHDFK
jgi:hypothetical protein